LWHHEGRRARMGASMMAPDYTQWHGNFEVAERFYTEFVPEVKELIEKAKTNGKKESAEKVEELLTEKDKGQSLYADSAYTGEVQEASITKVEMLNKVHEKGYKNKPLTEAQKQNNRIKSKYRARVEHIFGFVENSMHGTYMRSIGIARARVVIGLTNLAYNICRAVQILTISRQRYAQ